MWVCMHMHICDETQALSMSVRSPLSWSSSTTDAQKYYSLRNFPPLHQGLHAPWCLLTRTGSVEGGS